MKQLLVVHVHVHHMLRTANACMPRLITYITAAAILGKRLPHKLGLHVYYTARASFFVDCWATTAMMAVVMLLVVPLHHMW